MIESPPPTRPVYLAAGSEPVFAMFHGAGGPVAADTAVVLCPPWGWDEVASYSSRRAWANDLASHGHPVIRIDLPGSGDSGGDPSGPGRVDAWANAVREAAVWLLTVPGVTRVAVIGLGLSCLIAGKAIADGAPIDDLVLWSAPASGRAFLREQRAFAALQSSGLGEIDPTFPTGSLEVAGFTLSAETMEGIGPLELGSMPPGRLRRVLLLERDGTAGRVRLDPAWAGAGVEVAHVAAKGWTDMVFHPERYEPPLAVFAAVTSWLAEGSGARPMVAPDQPPALLDRAELQEGGIPMRESPIWIDQPFGRLFGVLGEPGVPSESSICAVFLNAGAVRRIGPNRLWVEVARCWNARGVPTVRMDLEGIGDADGDPNRYRDVGNFYTDAFGAQVRDILDDLARRGLGPRFALIGLCAGGYWAFHTAADDPRVVAALIINPRAMVWDADLLTRREAQKVQRLLEPALWTRIARGEVAPSRMLGVSRAVAARTVAAVRALPARWRGVDRDAAVTKVVERCLDALSANRTRVLLAFSGEEPVHDELDAAGILGRLGDWPNVSLERLPGDDHTLRPVAAQGALHRLLDRELDGLLTAQRSSASDNQVDATARLS